jgi:hypothetical protein
MRYACVESGDDVFTLFNDEVGKRYEPDVAVKCDRL